MPTFNLPGGVSIPPPPTPFSTPAANTLPATHAPTAPQTGGGGLINAAGNVLNTVTSTLRNILAPPAPTPAAPPPASPGGAAPVTATGPVNTPGPAQSLGNLPGNVANAAVNVVRTVANALPGAQNVIPQTPNPVSTQGVSTQQPAALAQPTSAQTPAVPAQQSVTPQPLAQPQTLQTLAQPQTLQTPQTLTQPQTSQPLAQPQTTNTLAQQATSVPVPQQAQPARTDAAFAPAGNPSADRAAVPQQAQPPVQANTPSAPQGAALLAAVPLATTVAQAPVAQQLAGNPQAQASGNPIAGTASLDAGGPVRAELTGTGTYTLDGPGLRRRGRLKAGAQELGQWMLAAAQGRLHLVRPRDDDTPREVAKAFQWLFWVLAIVAYGCLGLVLVSFLLSFGDLPTAPTLRRWTGEFAWAGLLAAVGAWWLGRQLMRAQRPPPDPIRR
ncbi:hypothetical protein [Luteimonas terrae]|uniref:hypothetical protein n=1 Tax=Luteimonas terrae TaxID=1530191 RepID=UPI00286BF5D9|nr:hypothetical protein [Luteimonas terrae]